MLFAITHCDTNGLIGLNHKLAYKSSEDFAEFKTQTLGDRTVLVMGRKTYEECGNLSERNVLALSNFGNLFNGKPTNKTVKTLSKKYRIIICGGQKVYEHYLDQCDHVIVHYSKQDLLTPNTSAVYFPLQQLHKAFKPTTLKDFDTFVQIWYFKH
jgi:dihydrofolate reductase